MVGSYSLFELSLCVHTTWAIPIQIINCFSCTDIEEIPESIRFCKNLRTADFSSNPIARFVPYKMHVICSEVSYHSFISSDQRTNMVGLSMVTEWVTNLILETGYCKTINHFMDCQTLWHLPMELYWTLGSVTYIHVLI